MPGTRKSFIRIYLEKYLKNNPGWKEKPSISDAAFSEFLSILGRKASNENKIKMWQKFMQKEDLYNKQDSAFCYDEEQWLQEVFKDYSKKK